MTSSIDLPPLEGPYIVRWLQGQFTKPIPPSKSLDLSGQTSVVVGGTNGIGLAFAHVLLEYKLSTLILAARDMEKGSKVAEELAKSHPSAKIEVWELELLSYESCQGFVERCALLQRIDFALLGGGIMAPDFSLNPSTGHEITTQIHYWSTALLALLLLPILKKKRVNGKPAHLTIVSSDLTHVAKFEERHSDPLLAAFDEPIPWDPMQAGARYESCKVLLMMLVLKLKDIVNPTDVIVNCLCPGASKPTGNERHQPWLFRSLSWVFRNLLGRPLEACAWTYLDAAVERGVESHGSYLASWQISPFPKLMYTEEGTKIMERVWTETLHEFQFAGVEDGLRIMKQAS